MGQYVARGFVTRDDVQIEDLGNGEIWMHGEIWCDGGVRVTVDKYLMVVNEGPPVVVQTRDYSYNASLSGRGNIFRYCSPHADHNCFHHRHDFDAFAKDPSETETIARIPGDWPTLGDVIEELFKWTWTNYEHLTWT